jgi:hypothetical protein
MRFFFLKSLHKSTTIHGKSIRDAEVSMIGVRLHFMNSSHDYFTVAV